MPNLNLSPEELLTTTRAVRKRLDLTRPVELEVIKECLEIALQAPTGGNHQGWHFIVVTDAAKREGLAELYRRALEAYAANPSSSGNLSLNDPERGPQQVRVMESATFLAAHLHEVPVLILACIEHDGSPATMGRGSSIYPAVQNLLLAARGLGLGSVITSLHKRYEKEIKELLGIPENVETAALLPIGYPADGVSYGPTRRSPVEEVTYQERWGSTG